MGDRELAQVTTMLRELSRKELVRPARQSSMAGEAEYAFWHILARDVAYNQLPRASRASRHVAAATWIESKAPGRVEDLADVLAYHYATALELARAAGQTEQATSLEAPALRFLGLAGERALGLDTGRCPGQLRAGARLSPRPGTRERAAALARFGEAAQHAGRLVEAAEALEEAITAFQATGDLRRRGAGDGNAQPRVRTTSGIPAAGRCPPRRSACWSRFRPAPTSSERSPSSPVPRSFRAAPKPVSAYAEQALALAEQLGLPRPARALGYRGLRSRHPRGSRRA